MWKGSFSSIFRAGERGQTLGGAHRKRLVLVVM